MNIPEISKHLICDEYGIWRSSQIAPISYPEGGNQRCFQLEDSSFWFQHRNACILAAIKRFPPSGAIFDIGGGNGYVTKRIIDEGFEAILLEPGPIGAFNAKIQRHLPHVICSTLEDACFKANSIPCIALFDVLEHIKDDSGFIKYVHSLLEPKGLIYITVPAHNWLWSLSDITAQHYRRYNQEMFSNLLNGSFETIYFTYFFRVLIPPILFFRSLPYKLGLAKNKNIMNTATEHGTKGGWGRKMITKLLAKEVEAIKDGMFLSLGTSCLLVARKKSVQQSQ